MASSSTSYFSMANPKLAWLIIMTVALAIFAIDTLTNVNIYVSILYVLVVIATLRMRSERTTFIAGMGTVYLTILSLIITLDASVDLGAQIVNCIISIFTVCTTSYLCIRIIRGEESAAVIRENVARVSHGVSLSELTASIAHEINQPLAAVVANAGAARRWLLADPPNFAESRQAIDSILRDGARAGAITNGLKRLVSMTPPERRPFDLTQMMDETVDLMRLEISACRAHIRLSGGKPILLLDGDRTLLQQVVINIIKNSLEALRETNSHQREVLIDVQEQEGYAVVQFRDTGLGVEPQKFDEIFKAFYTTKRSGMGMGLTICRTILEAHDGVLRAFPNDPRGMVFEMKIPIREVRS